MDTFFQKAKNPIALYGAGENCIKILEIYGHLGGIVCLVDSDPDKQGKEIFDLPVLSLEEAVAHFGIMDFYITPLSMRVKTEICHYLLSQGIEKERIIGFDDIGFEIYEGCSHLERILNVSDHGIYLCCAGKISQRPIIEHHDNVDETILQFLDKRDSLIGAIRSGQKTSCTGCHVIMKQTFSMEKRIRILVNGTWSYCNLSCRYCGNKKTKPENAKSSAVFISILQRLKKYDLLANDAIIFLASGEITVDPNRNEILDAVKGYKVHVGTNGVKFDEYMARTLENSGLLSISIDSGTRETYKMIKGMDAYDTVWENIKLYKGFGLTVQPKYIFLPENSNETDVTGFIQSLLDADINKLSCSADANRKNVLSAQEIENVCYMLDLAKANGISTSLDEFFWPEDKEKISNYSTIETNAIEKI